MCRLNPWLAFKTLNRFAKILFKQRRVIHRQHEPWLHTVLLMCVVVNGSNGIATLQHVLPVQKHWEFDKVWPLEHTEQSPALSQSVQPPLRPLGPQQLPPLHTPLVQPPSVV